VILTALSLAWSVTGLLWLGPRFFPEHLFYRGIADCGQSQGNVATGFILAEMADPAHTSGTAMGHGYQQLFYEPFLGGGILTAGLIIWGTVRNRSGSLQARR
jgi:ESS family glutamate:Na+ symporter